MKIFTEYVCFSIGMIYLICLIAVAIYKGWEGVRLIPRWCTAVGAAAMLALFFI